MVPMIFQMKMDMVKMDLIDLFLFLELEIFLVGGIKVKVKVKEKSKVKKQNVEFLFISKTRYIPRAYKCTGYPVMYLTPM